MKDSGRYDNGTKQTARGWMLNRISDRFPPCERKNKAVLYLPGRKDYDRRALLAKGFANHNIIAVDRDPLAIEAVRSGGGYGIAGDLIDVMSCCPHGRAPDVIIADLLSGIATDVIRFFAGSVMLSKTVVAINMLRGRDPLATLLGGAELAAISHLISGAQNVDLELHRGIKLLAFYAAICSKTTSKVDYVPLHFEMMKPAVYTYRSQDSGQFFDSLVLTTVTDFEGDMSREEWCKRLLKHQADRHPRKLQAAVRRTAATKATITKRLVSLP